MMITSVGNALSMDAFNYWFDYIVRNGKFFHASNHWAIETNHWFIKNSGFEYLAYYHDDKYSKYENRIRVAHSEKIIRVIQIYDDKEEVFTKNNFDPVFMKSLISKKET